MEIMLTDAHLAQSREATLPPSTADQNNPRVLLTKTPLADTKCLLSRPLQTHLRHNATQQEMDCTPSRRLFLLGAGALGHAVLDSLAGDRSLRKAFAGVLAIDRRIPDWAAGKMPEGCSFK